MRLGPPTKRPKYGAVKTVVDGITFASKAEARRYEVLRLLEIGGLICCLVLQPEFEIAPAVELDGRRRRARKYVADFGYIDDDTGEVVVEDVKGMRTQVYLLKRHLLKASHDIEVKEIR